MWMGGWVSFIEGMRQNDMSVYLGIDKWGVVEGGWNSFGSGSY